MMLCQRRADKRFKGVVRAAAIGFAVVIAAAGASASAFAQVGRSLDTINGDPNVLLQWSEGVWSLDHNPVSGCVTFPGGTTTGPGDVSKADSVECEPMPNGWSWNVTMPGPFTIYYDFYNIPPGYEVCGQVFGLTSTHRLRAAVDLRQDDMTCTDLETGHVLWHGRFSSFRPQYLGGSRLAAERCGRITEVPPTPTLESTWGTIKSIYR